MRIAILDVYYPEVLRAAYDGTGLAGWSYDRQLSALLRLKFGTSDFWKTGLMRANQGNVIQKFITNATILQSAWLTERRLASLSDENIVGVRPDIVLRQISEFSPDVIMFHSLSCLPVENLVSLRKDYKIVGQSSCEWPGDERVDKFHVVFTSFPHYVDRINRLGPKAVFLPLAFDATCLMAGITPFSLRRYPVVFVGGFGRHWPEAPAFFTEVAEAIPEFRWWGYGVDYTTSVLKERYNGEAWGLEMYKIYGDSQMVLNRHSGFIAQGYANNMRMFEATGMGAVLLTERASNLECLFKCGEVLPYGSAGEVIQLIREGMVSLQSLGLIAQRGQNATLTRHTYELRMRTVDELLRC
jgi:spore maturation protein CgeB